MKQFENDIGLTLEKKLTQYSPASSFEAIWALHSKTGMKAWYMKKSFLVPVVFLIALITFTAGFAAGDTPRRIDKVDYPFVNDKEVIGRWDAIDIVPQVEDFNPDKKIWSGDLYMKSQVFISGGKMLNSFNVGNGNLAYAPTSWTKGLVIDSYEKTAEKYVVKEINGSTYMIMECKTGDYIYNGFDPYCYVLKKVDSIDYSNYVPPSKEDNTDYPFIDDGQMKGTWECVDFVQTVGQFDPDKRQLRDISPIFNMVIGDNGGLSITTIQGVDSSIEWVWTKGLIINKDWKTANKCEIREIDGKTYMFMEWKNGDYLYRDFSPYYYVFKKTG